MKGKIDVSEELLFSVLKKLDRYLSKKVEDDRLSVDLENDFAFLFENNTLFPVKNSNLPDINTLLGVEEQKKQLLYNTEKFVKGLPANNVLLWGERGTGKTSLIKGVLKVFKDKNLKMIMVPKSHILDIWKLYDFIDEKRDYRFIIFIDDLSFEENQPEYKELKTVIDGGLKGIPDNLLFYVTSNRKNLLPIRFSDRDTDDTRISDTIEEKLSLVDRFGLRLGFFHMDKKTFLDIVDMYASLYGITMDREELHKRALQFSLNYGVRNGRVALQFIRSL